MVHNNGPKYAYTTAVAVRKLLQANGFGDASLGCNPGLATTDTDIR